MEFQIGDHVKSDNLGLEGIVAETGNCGQPNCDKKELTFDEKGHRTRFFYHVEHFELVSKN